MKKLKKETSKIEPKREVVEPQPFRDDFMIRENTLKSGYLREISLVDITHSRPFATTKWKHKRLFPMVEGAGKNENYKFFITEKDNELMDKLFVNDDEFKRDMYSSIKRALRDGVLSISENNDLITIRINLASCIRVNHKIINSNITRHIFDWDFYSQVLKTASLLAYLRTKPVYRYDSIGNNSEPRLNVNIELCGISDVGEDLIKSKLHIPAVYYSLREELKEVDLIHKYESNKRRYEIVEQVIRGINQFTELLIYTFAKMEISNNLEMFYNRNNETIIQNRYSSHNEVLKHWKKMIGKLFGNGRCKTDNLFIDYSECRFFDIWEKFVLNEPIRVNSNINRINWLELYLDKIISNEWMYSPYTAFFYRRNYQNLSDFFVGEYTTTKQDAEMALEYLDTPIVCNTMMFDSFHKYNKNLIGNDVNSKYKFANLNISVSFNRQFLGDYYFSNLIGENIVDKLDNITANRLNLELMKYMRRNPIYFAIMNRLSMSRDSSLRVNSKSLYKTGIQANNPFVNENSYSNPILAKVNENDLISSFFTLNSIQNIVKAAMSTHCDNIENLPQNRFDKVNLKYSIKSIVFDNKIHSSSKTIRKFFEKLFKSVAYGTVEGCVNDNYDEFNIESILDEYLNCSLDSNDWWIIFITNFRNLVSKLLFNYFETSNEKFEINSSEIVDETANKLFHINDELNFCLDMILLEKHKEKAPVVDESIIVKILKCIANFYSEFNPNGILFEPMTSTKNRKIISVKYSDYNENSKEQVVSLLLTAAGDNDFEFFDGRDDNIIYYKEISIKLFYNETLRADNSLHAGQKGFDRYLVPTQVNIPFSTKMLHRVELSYVTPTENNIDDIIYLSQLEKDINSILQNTVSVEQFIELFNSTIKDKIYFNSKGKKLDPSLLNSNWFLTRYGEDVLQPDSNVLIPATIGSCYANELVKLSQNIEFIKLEDGLARVSAKDSFMKQLLTILSVSYIDSYEFNPYKLDNYIDKTINEIYMINQINQDDLKYLRSENEKYIYDFSILSYPHKSNFFNATEKRTAGCFKGQYFSASKEDLMKMIKGESEDECGNDESPQCESLGLCCCDEASGE